jgi:hypothetical protein
MGLDMKSKHKMCNRLYRRYQKAGKKARGALLEEHVPTLGYNCDYLAHLLTNWGKPRYAVVSGKAVKYVAKPSQTAEKPRKRANMGGRSQKHGPAFAAVLFEIWEFFEWPCGKLLSPLIRLIIDFLVPVFGLDEQTRALLLQVNPSTIDRLLSKEKAWLRIKGRSLTKP